MKRTGAWICLATLSLMTVLGGLALGTNNPIFYVFEGIAAIIGILLSIIYMTFVKRYKKRKEEFKIIEGMLKLEKKINLEVASNVIGCSIEELKNLIYNLAEGNKVSGEFKGDVFMVESEIDVFVELLDKEFSKWEKIEKDKKGKI